MWSLAKNLVRYNNIAILPLETLLDPLLHIMHYLDTYSYSYIPHHSLYHNNHMLGQGGIAQYPIATVTTESIIMGENDNCMLAPYYT